MEALDPVTVAQIGNGGVGGAEGVGVDKIRDLLFGMRVCKHVKSNAIVFAKNGATTAIGAGQMSRLDSVRIARAKALSKLPDEREMDVLMAVGEQTIDHFPAPAAVVGVQPDQARERFGLDPTERPFPVGT